MARQEICRPPFEPAPSPHQARMEELVRALWRDLDAEAPSCERPLVPVARVLDECALNAHEVASLTGRLALQFLAERGVATGDTFPCAPRGDGDSGAAGAVALSASGIGWDEPLAGFLFANGGGGAVFVRSDDPIARRRFSAAHELGHFLLHFVPQAARHFARRQSLQLIAAEPALDFLPEHAGSVVTLARPSAAVATVESAAEAAHRQREAEADAFAAELLMPCALVSQVAARERARWGDGDLMWRMSQQFLVSRKAMWKRLVQLGWLDTPSPYDC